MNMFEPLRPDFTFSGIQVIESERCIQNYQLTDFTKELMGREWVEQFDSWAAHSLPKQPACYMVGRDKMVVHPSVSRAIRENVKNKARWFSSYNLGAIRSSNSGIIACTGA